MSKNDRESHFFHVSVNTVIHSNGMPVIEEVDWSYCLAGDWRFCSYIRFGKLHLAVHEQKLQGICKTCVWCDMMLRTAVSAHSIPHRSVMQQRKQHKLPILAECFMHLPRKKILRRPIPKCTKAWPAPHQLSFAKPTLSIKFPLKKNKNVLLARLPKTVAQEESLYVPLNIHTENNSHVFVVSE